MIQQRHDPYTNVHLSAGQVHDASMLNEVLVGADDALLNEHGVPMAWPVKLAGDKGYRAAWVDAYLR